MSLLYLHWSSKESIQWDSSHAKHARNFKQTFWNIILFFSENSLWHFGCYCLRKKRKYYLFVQRPIKINYYNYCIYLLLAWLYKNTGSYYCHPRLDGRMLHSPAKTFRGFNCPSLAFCWMIIADLLARSGFRHCSYLFQSFLSPSLWEMAQHNWNEPAHDKTNKMACAPIEDWDHPGHSPSLIRVFALSLKKAWVFSYPLSAQQRLWSN